MKIAEKNLLRTSLFDDKIETNQGNNWTILPPPRELHSKLYPEDSFVLSAQFKASFFTGIQGGTVQDNGNGDQISPYLEATNPRNEMTENINADSNEDVNESQEAENDDGIATNGPEQYEAHQQTILQTGYNSQRSARLGNCEQLVEGEGDHVDYVSKSGIECFQMTWQQYDLMSGNTAADEKVKYDLILTDPPYSLR